MLQKVSVPFVDESICEKSYEADGYAVTDGMIFAAAQAEFLGKMLVKEIVEVSRNT